MPLIAQIWIIVLTVAVVALTGIAIRLMSQLDALNRSLTNSRAELLTLVQEVRRTSARMDKLVVEMSDVTRVAQIGVARFEGIATRCSTLAGVLLDEVAGPITEVASVIHGIRTGARYLFQRWQPRAGKRANAKRGDNHESEQRWADDGGVPAWSGSRSGPGASVGPAVR